MRRLLLAIEEGDLAKLPFSDDVTPESRLLMRRSVNARIQELAPFLTFDPDPYIVVGDDGRLSWIVDGFTTSDSYPYSRHYRLGREGINYLRNSVKAVVDAYDGTTTFYVFDAADPVIAAYRGIFPTLFRDASAMPAGLRRHVRYPELMLKVQAAAYGLYHMTDPEVFYNREDLWTVASEVGMNEQREQSAQPMEPNFVLMTLPGEKASEFVEILPFTPANRNNLIGWIAGRSDEPHYGTAVVYNFPKTKLVDGPLQVEARIDQNPQLSGQLSLWNQQGSHVRRGNLIVIPIGRALLYAEPIYLQAERSPMPELRLVVLALQDRLAYGPTFESAMAGLFGNAASTLNLAAAGVQAAPAAAGSPPAAAPSSAARPPVNVNEHDRRRRARSCRLPAADRRRQARRGRPEARIAQAPARRAAAAALTLSRLSLADGRSGVRAPRSRPRYRLSRPRRARAACCRAPWERPVASVSRETGSAAPSPGEVTDLAGAVTPRGAPTVRALSRPPNS